MADVSANLLFTIAADSNDAQANVQRFRSLLAKDLAALKADFNDWARGVFGDLSTTEGKFTAVAAGAAAMGVAIVGAAVSAGKALWDLGVAAAEYADKIEDGQDVTGLSAETMSVLSYAADQAGLSYETLTRSLVIFESNGLKALQGLEQQERAFRALGISQEQVRAGQKDLLPLLMQVADAFNELESVTEKVAIARELFGRGGAQLVEMLSMGSAGLREMAEQARELGMVLGEGDLLQGRMFRVEMQQLDATLQGVKYTIGAGVIPMMIELALAIETAWRVAQRAPEVMGEVPWWQKLIPGVGEFKVIKGLLESYSDELDEARARMLRRVQALMAEGSKGLVDTTAEATAQAKEEFQGLSHILEELNFRAAAAAGGEERLRAELDRLLVQTERARQQLRELINEGRLAPEVIAREMAALEKLPQAIQDFFKRGMTELTERRNQWLLAAGEQLQAMLLAQQEDGWRREEAMWDAQIEALRRRMEREGTLTAENERLLLEVQEAGRRRRAEARSQAFVDELRELQDQMAAIVTTRFTSLERIEWMYAQDVARFSEAEEEKRLALVESEEEQEAIRQQYQLNREAALARYQSALNELRNSQGWEGLFGSVFANAIRGNEELLREWATSAERSMLMVRVAVESLDEMARRTFANFAAGMGQNIAYAVVYSKSLGTAMREAAAATLASLAAEALVYAIYSTGLGFLRLAQHDYVAAGQAFTAAAIWGAVGGAAAVAGRMIAPKDERQAGGRGEGGGGREAGGGPAGREEKAEPRVAIYISGHVVGASGIEELTEIINEAVEHRDVRLVSSEAKRAGAVVR